MLFQTTFNQMTNHLFHIRSIDNDTAIQYTRRQKISKNQWKKNIIMRDGIKIHIFHHKYQLIASPPTHTQDKKKMWKKFVSFMEKLYLFTAFPLRIDPL